MASVCPCILNLLIVQDILLRLGLQGVDLNKYHLECCTFYMLNCKLILEKRNPENY